MASSKPSVKSLKQDISQKLQQISLMRQNWTRHNANETDDDDEVIRERTGTRKSAAYESIAGKITDVSNASNPKQTFQKWMNSRRLERPEDTNLLGNGDDDYADDADSRSDLRSDFEPELQRLSISKSDNFLREKSSNIPDSTADQYSKSGSLLNVDEFDSLADNIARRVRDELGIKNCAEGQSPSSVSSNNSRPKTHYCEGCLSLMVGPNNRPFLLIPCGHTACESCLRKSLFCNQCNATAENTILNSGFLSVISGFQLRSTRNEYKPSQYEFNLKEKEVPVDYGILRTRFGILSTEKQNLHNQINDFDQLIQNERGKISSLDGKKKDIERQIRSLIESLNTKQLRLTEEQKSHEMKIEELTCKKEDSKDKLALLEKTLCYLEDEMRK